MPLSQATMNRAGAIVFQALRGLLLSSTILHRATSTSTPVSYGPFGMLWRSYSEHIIAMQALLGQDAVRVQRDDRRVSLLATSVTWVPTLYDEVIHPDTTHWRIISFQGGTTSPLWTFHVRKRVA